jgi:PAS domain S-box-containing protein
MGSKEEKKHASENMISLDSIEIIDDGSLTNDELLLDASPFAMILCNIEGKILSLNTKMANIFQQSKNELIGTSVFPLLELGAGERRRQIIHRVIHEKKPYIFEDFERGSWWRTIALPIQDAGGNVIKLAGIIENVDMQKEQLRKITEQNEEFWKRLIKHSSNVFLITDENGIIRYASESVSLIIKYDPEKMIGKKIVDYVYEPDKSRAINYFSKVLAEKNSMALSHRIVDKKGAIRFMHTTANNLLDNPVVRGIIITTRDVTKTHKKEIETKETKEYLQSIINSTSELIFSLTSEGRITIWNDRLVDITGFSAGSMRGKNLFSLSLLDDVDSFKAYLESCIQGVGRPFTFKVISRQGEERFLRVSGSVVRSDDGIEKTVVFTGRDITSEQSGHGKLIWGFSYLITDVDTRVAIELVNGLLDDHDGLIISRDDVSRDLFSDPAGNGRVIQHFFSSDDARDGMVSDPGMLVEDVSSFFSMHDNAFVLIDRLDFLIALYGFKTVMRSIYMVSNLAYRHNGIVLIRLNPSIVSSFELSVLHEELKSLPEENIERITIDKKLFDILEFVYQRDQNQMLTSYKNISTQFSITKVTTAKRISSLSDKGLVVIKKRGRLKTIHVTAKGKNLLQRKKVQ